MRILFSLLITLILLIKKIYNYLSTDQFRDLVDITDDFESENYFKYFIMNLKYFPNTPLTYLRKCQEGFIFGYFRYGNLTNYLSYEDYGTLGINMNLIVNTDFFSANKNDSINFYLNGEISQSINLKDLKNNTFPPLVSRYCDKPVMIFNISLIFINKKTSQYSPIEITISSNLRMESDVDWAISGIKLIKQACPKKCSMCNNNICLNCGKNMIFKSGVCSCDSNSNLEFYDFADDDKKINCKEKYQLVHEEDYSKKYLTNLWFWNTYPVTPFNFRYKCPDDSSVFFGGPNNFGDRDTLTKFIKFNDNSIFKNFQPEGFNYNYVPYSNYKISFSVGFFNWNSTYAGLSVATSSKSNPLDLSISDTSIQNNCNFNNSILYLLNSFEYSSLSDNPVSANITFIATAMPSRKNNNFALTNFKFYFSPCHKTCATCSSPAIDACNTCLDSNAVLQNGKCVCKAGFNRDTEHPLFPCVAFSKTILVTNGIPNDNTTQSYTILQNNIEFSSYYCQNTRKILGGGTRKKFNYTTNTYEILDKANPNVYLDFIINAEDLNFYKVKVNLELITDEDLSLSFPFKIIFNDEYEITEFESKQIKYLKYVDSTNTLLFNCYDNQPANKIYKHYNVVFYIHTNQKLFYLKIQNNFNNFWGVHNLNYNYFNCHNNCADCIGYTQFDCVSCKIGMKMNPLNINKSLNSFSCICDEPNGFIKVSDVYSPVLQCLQGKKKAINYFYINDLDSENFDTSIWKSNFRQLNNQNDIQLCEYSKVLGNYNVQKYGFYERKVDFIKKLPNFDYFQIDFSFNIYFFKNIANFIVKVFLDNNFIWGNTNTAASIEEAIFCNEKATFYRKYLNFTYYNNDYFKNSLNKKNPTLRIQAIPDSDCSFNSDCGWGINNLTIKVNKINIAGNSTCNYRPFISCPCAPLSSQCSCFPGYYSLKASWGDYNCLPCIANCLTCPNNKCSDCNYGYSLVNNVCIPSPKGMLASQNTMMKIDLSKYYSNYIYDYTGISYNFWAKFGDVSSTIEKPISLIDPYLLTYNSTFGSYYLRNSNFNYLFSFSNYFPILINYTTANPKSFYENNWIPYSIGLSYSNSFKNFFIQISINNEVAKSIIVYESRIPQLIILFNYFSKIQYRYIKVWDRYLTSDELNSINYVQDYAKAPSDMLLFLKLTEGYLKNRGNSNMVFVSNVLGYLWGYDNNPSPLSCNEDEFYNSKTGMCSACDNTCQHCFSGSSNGCIDCNDPYPFIDISNRICYPVCQNNQIAIYKYETNKMCQGSCPSTCDKCDNINGCISCKKGFILYKNSCVAFCTPEMSIDIKGDCSDNIQTQCIPSAVIKNRNPFFFMDGTDFNLNVQLNNCNRPLVLKWSSSLKEGVMIKEEGRSLFLDSSKFHIPQNHTFSLNLLNENQTQILSQDQLVVEFMTYSVNGGKITPFYIDDVLNFSLEKFSANIAPSYGGTMKYIWTCPSWVPFKSCNIRINKPLITSDLKAITDKQYIKTDSLYDVKVQVLAGGVSKAAYRGFFIVYSQPNFNSYFNFTIKNSTVLSYNDELNIAMIFNNNIYPNVIKDNIQIKWDLNTNIVNSINGYSLPDFKIKFDGVSGSFNLTCTIFYRNNTLAQKTLSKYFILTIPEPPSTGKLDAYPQYSITLTETRINLIASNFIFKEDPNRKNFRYEYFYRNVFGEYLWIVNKEFIPSQLTLRLMPITDSIKVKCFYDPNSFSNVEAYMNLTVKINTLVDYNEIDKIFPYDIENALNLLEAYALNLRNHTLAKSTADFYSRKILDKLLTVVNTNKTDSKDIIHFNNEKVGTILESISLKFLSYSQISEKFNFIVDKIMSIASELGEDFNFSLFYCNNYLRALDNLLNINPSNIKLEKVDLTILENYQILLMKAFRDITKGSYKLANLNNVNIFGLTVDSKFLKNDIVYLNDESLNPHKTKSPVFFGDYSSIYVNGTKPISDINKISLTIPNKIIESFENDFILIIKQYTGWNPVITEPSNYTDDNWYSVSSDIIEITFVDILQKNISQSNNTLNGTNITNSSQISNNSSSQNETTNPINNGEKDYKINMMVGNIDSNLVIINFTLSKKYSPNILNYTSCVRISNDTIEDKNIHPIEDYKCNTWFDFKHNLIQCECDGPGYYSVGYNPKFKYNRQHIQFPQTSDSIANPWGMGAMGFMLGSLIFVSVFLYFKDRKELTHFSVAANKKKYYDELRKSLNESSTAIKNMTFPNLYARIFKFNNDFYNLMNFREFYFLRANRLLILLLRVYIIIVLCFFKQEIILEREILDQVELRDIRIKATRKIIYNWVGDWVKEILTSLTLAIPIGLVMFLYPRLSEWLFHYEEANLRFSDNCVETANLGNKFFSYKLNKLDEYYSNNVSQLNNQGIQMNNKLNNFEYKENQNINIEMQDMTKRQLLPMEKSLQYQIAYKKKRAFLNFNKMFNSIILNIKNDLFINEKHDILPEDLAPLYSKRLNGQVENYELRMFQIRAKLHQNNEQKKNKDSKNDILKNRENLLFDLKMLLNGRDANIKEMELKYGYRDYKNFRKLNDLRNTEPEESDERVESEKIKVDVKSNKENSFNNEVLKSNNDSMNNSGQHQKLIKEQQIPIADQHKVEENKEEKEIYAKIDQENEDKKDEPNVDKNADDGEIKDLNKMFETDTTPLVKSNAYIPKLVEKNKKLRLMFIIKVTIIILLLLGLTYITAWKITVLKNQGGENKAIFWVIMVSISITFNYLIFLPVMCAIKTKILLTYGPFHPRKFFCSFKYFIFLLLITEVDRAVFKELKETIKNNNSDNNEKIMTSFFGLEDESETGDNEEKNEEKKEDNRDEENEDSQNKQIEKNKTLINDNSNNNKDNNNVNVITNKVNLTNYNLTQNQKNYTEINKRDKEIEVNNNLLEIEDIQRKENIEKEENDKNVGQYLDNQFKNNDLNSNVNFNRLNRNLDEQANQANSDYYENNFYKGLRK